VAVLKAAQTGVEAGQPGDVDEVRRLVGTSVTCRELVRFPDPLAPATAARRAGAAPVTPLAVADAARELAASHDLVLVEGAGGLLVHFDDAGGTIADAAVALGAPVLVVTGAGLGTLNHTALTVEALRTRGLCCVGMVIGAWPAEPDLAARCNLADLPSVTGLPLLGALRAGAGSLTRAEFLRVARRGLESGLPEREVMGCRRAPDSVSELTRLPMPAPANGHTGSLRWPGEAAAAMDVAADMDSRFGELARLIRWGSSSDRSTDRSPPGPPEIRRHPDEL
jgi:dethiobiotin synthetase